VVAPTGDALTRQAAIALALKLYDTGDNKSFALDAEALINDADTIHAYLVNGTLPDDDAEDDGPTYDEDSIGLI
jgi:hypothetical protein